MDGWNRKELWTKRGDGFSVEVSHHTVDITEVSEGPHRWCVYAYIYPQHAMFEEFDGSDMWQDAALRLPHHCGPSYLKWHCDDEGKKTSVQVGADYNHLGDDEYTHMECSDDAMSVFADAEKLMSFLSGGFNAVSTDDGL